jgi:hypothetical protein
VEDETMPKRTIMPGNVVPRNARPGAARSEVPAAENEPTNGARAPVYALRGGKRRAVAESTFRKSKEGGISVPLSMLKALFKRHYYYSDDNVIDVVLGTVAGNDFDNDPLWLYLIGPPSAGKTELLYSIFDCPETYFLSDFTPNSLISGYRDPPPEGGKRKKDEPSEEDLARLEGEGGARDTEEQVAPAEADEDEDPEYSLLPELNGKVVVTKDFTLIHDKPAETRAQILSILRDVYDGFASRRVGNAKKTKGFHSRFNYLAGMTPDIEKSWSLNTLGERFLMYRILIEDRRTHARLALANVRKKGGTAPGALAVRKQLQTAVKRFMEHLKRFEPEVDDETAERIIDLAEILSTCRTYVYRDKNDDMPCLPQAELAARVAKQLMRVGQSVALVRGRRRVTEDEFEVMKRIALDSLPSNRRLLLEALYEHREMMQPLETFAAAVSRISRNTVRRELENLAELGAVEREKRGVAVHTGKTKSDGTQKNIKTTQAFYRLSVNFAGYCDNVGGVP